MYFSLILLRSNFKDLRFDRVGKNEKSEPESTKFAIEFEFN